MLLAAEAGDILYGTYDPYGGVATGGFLFTFMGSGRDKLDGIQFAGADSSELPPWLGGEFDWSGVSLSDIFNEKILFSGGINSAGYHIVRLMWKGAINSNIEPVFIRSTAIIKASQREAEYREWLLAVQNGSSPNTGDVISAMLVNIGNEMIEGGVCLSFNDACSFVWAGISGAYEGLQQDNFAYSVHSGPFTFYYSWTQGTPGISNGGMSGESNLYFQGYTWR